MWVEFDLLYQCLILKHKIFSRNLKTWVVLNLSHVALSLVGLSRFSPGSPCLLSWRLDRALPNVSVLLLIYLFATLFWCNYLWEWILLTWVSVFWFCWNGFVFVRVFRTGRKTKSVLNVWTDVLKSPESVLFVTCYWLHLCRMQSFSDGGRRDGRSPAKSSFHSIKT